MINTKAKKIAFFFRGVVSFLKGRMETEKSDAMKEETDGSV